MSSHYLNIVGCRNRGHFPGVNLGGSKLPQYPQGFCASLTWTPVARLALVRHHGIWVSGVSVEQVAKHKHGGWVISVRFSHDGTWVASGSADKWLRVFDAKEENIATRLKGGDDQ